MLDDSWVIIGDISETMENQDEKLVGGVFCERDEEWSGQRWGKFTSGEKILEENVCESIDNVYSDFWMGDTWRKYV